MNDWNLAKPDIGVEEEQTVCVLNVRYDFKIDTFPSNHHYSEEQQCASISRRGGACIAQIKDESGRFLVCVSLDVSPKKVSLFATKADGIEYPLSGISPGRRLTMMKSTLHYLTVSLFFRWQV